MKHEYLIFLFTLETVYGGFMYGQPCNKRNTARLHSNRLVLPIPISSTIKCLDITSACKNVTFGKKWPLEEVDTLYADHMNLSTILKSSLQMYLPKLQFVDMSENSIQRVPIRMYKYIPNLTTFLLRGNCIYIPKRSPLMVSNTITTLSLSDNNIKYITSLTFSRMPNLKVLYLDKNLLETITADMFIRLKHLKYLDLSENKLTIAPIKDSMPKSLKVILHDPLEKDGTEDFL